MATRTIDDFLQQVCQQVRFKLAHRGICLELEDHYESCREELVAQGLDEVEATAQAMERMGDPQAIGVALDQVHKPQCQWPILVITVALATLGVVLMFVSTAHGAGTPSPFGFLLYTLMGLVILLGAYFFDYRKLQRYYVGSFFLAIGLIVMAEISDLSVNGIPYLRLFSLSINVFTATAPLFLVALSGLIVRQKGQGMMGLLKVGAMSGVILLILVRYDLSGSAMLGIVYLSLIVLACFRGHFGVAKGRYLLLIFGVVALGSMVFCRIFIFSGAYQMSRFLGMLSPLDHIETTGWQYYVANEVIHHSQWIGPMTVGDAFAGRNMPTYDAAYQILPEPYTDYALTNLIGSLGYLMALVIVIMLALLFYQGFKTILKIRSDFGGYLAMGFLTLLLLQSLLNIGINLTMIPMVVPTSLPFISYSGTAMVTNLFMIGLILSVWRLNRLNDPMECSDKKHKQKRVYMEMEDGRLVIEWKKARLNQNINHDVE